jgi:hypothetical protein
MEDNVLDIHTQEAVKKFSKAMPVIVLCSNHTLTPSRQTRRLF